MLTSACVLEDHSAHIAQRVVKILETEAAIERLSERVQGMVLMGQDRDDLKDMAISLARMAKVIAAMCGEPLHFSRES